MYSLYFVACRTVHLYAPLRSLEKEFSSRTESTTMSKANTTSAIQYLHRATGIPKNQLDRLVSLFVHVGDRIQVQLDDTDGEKLNRATVKYLGPLDKGPHSPKLFAGIKLDSPIGDNDGTFKLVRYFTVPSGKGKIVRLSQIRTLFNAKITKFSPIEDYINEHLKKTKN